MRTPLIKNITPVARTYSEARRDADYACSIDVPKREWEDAVGFLSGIALMSPVIGLVVYVVWIVLGM